MLSVCKSCKYLSIFHVTDSPCVYCFLGFGEQEDVCLFESLENVELKQQLEASKTELEHARKSWKHIQEQNDSATQFILNMQQQLEASQKLIEVLRSDVLHAEGNLTIMTDLAEERRLALEKCSPWNMNTFTCMLCGNDADKRHKPDCDWVRLCKKD